LLNFHASSFRHETRIPATKFRPESTIIPFFIEVPDLEFNLSLPRWNTHALHAPQQGNNLGTAVFFRLDASYRYFAEVREEHVEHLTLDFAVCHHTHSVCLSLDLYLSDAGCCIQSAWMVHQIFHGSPG
jgi:hypothetical protein